LNAWGFALIDCQMPTQHLHSFGARAIARSDFAAYLKHHLDQSSSADWVA
jgi:leucyl/phenylalanyl-tRNA--protein transferase